MQVEIYSLHDHDIQDIVKLLDGCKPVGSKWVFKLKIKDDGSVDRCKASLVTLDFSQREGLYRLQ